MYIMQGDAYSIPIHITNCGETVTLDTAETVEVSIGDVTKKYPDGVSFDGTDWFFHLTQEEAFTLPAVGANCRVRVKFLSGDVIGVSLGKIDITTSLSKEVL